MSHNVKWKRESEFGVDCLALWRLCVAMPVCVCSFGKRIAENSFELITSNFVTEIQ